MSDAPHFDIDPDAFWQDPYPALAKMRSSAPIAYVPQLGATLLTRHGDIFTQEKRTESDMKLPCWLQKHFWTHVCHCWLRPCQYDNR